MTWYKVCGSRVTDTSPSDLSYVWSDISFELKSKFNKLVIDYMNVVDDIIESYEFTKSLKIPFCHEHIRLKYLCVFENMMVEMKDINNEMTEYPGEVQNYRDIIVDKGCKQLSESGVTYLENMLGYFAHRIDYVNGELQERKKRGYNSFNNSQLVNMPCSF